MEFFIGNKLGVAPAIPRPWILDALSAGIPNETFMVATGLLERGDKWDNPTREWHTHTHTTENTSTMEPPNQNFAPLNLEGWIEKPEFTLGESPF